jgi:radical SAM superfamily enzyme YgiQ (UPF0313 family)
MPILAISGPLVDQGYHVMVFDSRVDDHFDQFLHSLKEEPLFFGLSVMVGYQIIDGLDLSRRIKKKFPNVPVVWGGWFPSMEPEVIMKEDSIDIGVRGPGERTVIRLARCLEGGEDIATVGALVYRNNGKVAVDTPAMPRTLITISRSITF